MVSSEMDKTNLTLFLALLAVMVFIVGVDMINSSIEVERVGEPVVKPPFNVDDYNFTFNEDELVINLSPRVLEEYGGSFLNVYAYDEKGNHIFELKRVVNGKIIIDRNEPPGSNVTFSNNVVSLVERGDKEASFYQILKEARDAGRYYGLEKCLLCRQCIGICPVAAVQVLVKDTSPEGRGRIIPDINYNTCIKCGRCAARCPTSIIFVEENESA
jgi:ferredoxin